MAASRAAATSYIAAGVLAAITLFTFYTLRDYGPESAVRRFHDDVRTGNLSDLQKVTIGGDINSTSSRNLRDFLRYLDKNGASSRIGDVDLSRPGVASVLTIYQGPLRNDFLVWIVTLDQNRAWRVDTYATQQAFIPTHQRPVGDGS